MTTTALPVVEHAPCPSHGPNLDYELVLDCVHCGLCTASCPTYVETSNEADSPRGRIVLLRALVKREIGADDATLVGYSPRAGGAVCGACAGRTEAVALSPDGIRGIEALLAQPLADAVALALGERARRDALTVITASYGYHGGFRLRTLSA